MGPTAWMTFSHGRSYALVILALPVLQPPSVLHSASRPRPAARWMAPSTPPPPSRELFAALTIAPTSSCVISPRYSVTRSLRDLEGVADVDAGTRRPVLLRIE